MRFLFQKLAQCFSGNGTSGKDMEKEGVGMTLWLRLLIRGQTLASKISPEKGDTVGLATCYSGYLFFVNMLQEIFFLQSTGE